MRLNLYYIKWSILSFIFIFSLTNTYAQNFSISHILPYLSDDSLKIDLGFKGVFGEKVRKPLLAGIPILVQMKLNLTDSELRVTQNKDLEIHIFYNIWEENFQITTSQNVTKRIQTFEELQKWFRQIYGIYFTRSQKLFDKESYQIKAKSKISILTRKQSKQLQWWMQNSDPTEEDSPSKERSTGFRLNLNRVIQMFFSSDKESEDFYATGQSAKFTLSELKLP